MCFGSMILLLWIHKFYHDMATSHAKIRDS